MTFNSETLRNRVQPAKWREPKTRGRKLRGGVLVM